MEVGLINHNIRGVGPLRERNKCALRSAVGTADEAVLAQRVLSRPRCGVAKLQTSGRVTYEMKQLYYNKLTAY